MTDQRSVTSEAQRTVVRAPGFAKLVDHYTQLPVSVLISQITEGGSQDPLPIERVGPTLEPEAGGPPAEAATR